MTVLPAKLQRCLNSREHSDFEISNLDTIVSAVEVLLSQEPFISSRKFSMCMLSADDVFSASEKTSTNIQLGACTIKMLRSKLYCNNDSSSC